MAVNVNSNGLWVMSGYHTFNKYTAQGQRKNNANYMDILRKNKNTCKLSASLKTWN